jgi:hypothetical protein
MRDSRLFVVVTTIQFVATVALLVYAFGAGMARFDSGAPAALIEIIAGWLLAALSFPLLTAVRALSIGSIPGLWGYLLFAANAALSGVAVVAARRRWRRVAPARL